jgi:hypothetical protein
MGDAITAFLSRKELNVNVIKDRIWLVALWTLFRSRRAQLEVLVSSASAVDFSLAGHNPGVVWTLLGTLRLMTIECVLL